jgi:hypothetical protein
VEKARRRLLGQEHPDTLAARTELANVLYLQGNSAATRDMPTADLGAWE